MTDLAPKANPAKRWPTYVNCSSYEQFAREKALHDAQMHNPAYIGFARYRYTALVAKLHNRWPITVAEYVEFHASIPSGYSVPAPTPVTEEQRAAASIALTARIEAEKYMKFVRENTPFVETVSEVMSRLQNSPELRQRFIDEHPAEVEQWVLRGSTG